MAKAHNQLIFLILTANNEVIGGFVDQPLKMNSSKYVGTGDCLIFRWKAKTIDDMEELQYGNDRDKIHTDLAKLEAYHSTESNQLYFFCDDGGFGFGSE